MFESLIPKPILQRYISLLVEHRRIILSGPSGTGKTYLANRLSEYLVLREGRELADGIIATFNVDHKSSKVRALLADRLPSGLKKPSVSFRTKCQPYSYKREASHGRFSLVARKDLRIEVRLELTSSIP